MPKRGKGKRFQQAKINQPMKSQPAVSSQTPAIPNAPKRVAPSISTSTAAAKPVVNTAILASQSAYVISELKRIGILTGIIIVVLIILVIILT
jgi:hypothetical protein